MRGKKRKANDVQAGAVASQTVERGNANHAKLWRRIGFVMLAMLVYRLGGNIPLPGIDLVAVAQYFKSVDSHHLTIFAVGIGPYISASILVQVFIWVARMTPKLVEVEGRRRINTYIRRLTVILSLLQGYGIAKSLIAVDSNWSSPLVHVSEPLFIISTMLTLTAGTMFLMWLADEITKRGFGDGVM
ncbi:MAG: hypothetical protein P8Y67_03635 [Alphaproteobacteria bacterium]